MKARLIAVCVFLMLVAAALFARYTPDAPAPAPAEASIAKAGKAEAAERAAAPPEQPVKARQAQPPAAAVTAAATPPERPRHKLPSRERKVGRDRYFFDLLRDPATNAIPAGIRRRELSYARTLPRFGEGARKSGAALTWTEAGPQDVGGRTRALAIDVTNANVVLAGGVAGGIWKSTNGGNTWTLKTAPSDHISVTGIAQDPRPGQQQIWYAVSGEFSGSMQDRGWTAYYYGSGFYRSTDGGETWQRLSDAGSPVQWDTNLDRVSKVIVSPVTGSVFIAANATGIFRSTNQGQSFDLALGQTNDHIWSDVDVASDGTLLVALSQGWNQGQANAAGLYRSTNDGQTWQNITPAGFPTDHARSVVAIAPSNPNLAYVLTYTGQSNNNVEDLRFHSLNLGNGTGQDRSANLPDFGEPVGGFTTQGGYDMTLAVKPDDPNFVIIGGTNLYRSRDGFATRPNVASEGWIGGYATLNNVSQYTNHHPDQHALVFDPSNPNRLWSGHDGGISVVDDIRSQAAALPWQSKDQGYNVTQFYTVALPRAAGDNRIMGGTQDNGSPFFTNGAATSVDVSSGDGSYAYFGQEYAYTSSQNGFVVRSAYDATGTPDGFQWSTIRPKNAPNAVLFIHPFAVDPQNEDVMYYPVGETLWRNTALRSIPNFERDGTTVGWAPLSVGVPSGYFISTLAVSSQPAHVLYYGGSSNNQPPVLFRLDQAHQANDGEVNISIPGAPAGAYVHGIAVNPANASEILVALSNYNIVGLYHSTDGGQTYRAVEGNLTGTNQQPGPSIRSATILPSNGETTYLVGTSTGLYSTSFLEGANTVWELQAADQIGNAIVEYVTSRPSDGRVAAATHGRGIFVGQVQQGGTGVAAVDVAQVDLSTATGGTATATFTLSNTGTGSLSYTITPEEPTPAGAAHKNGPGGAALSNFMAADAAKKLAFAAPGVAASAAAAKAVVPAARPLPTLAGDDVLFSDDGNDQPDDFVGFGNTDPFFWLNGFSPSGFDFELDQVLFFMRSENAATNPVWVAVYDQTGQPLVSGTVDLPVSPAGGWFFVNLNSPIRFANGEPFFVEVGTSSGNVNFPAGADVTSSILGNSFYFDSGSGSYVGLNTVPGFESGAFLIRATGTIDAAPNQAPNAVALASTLNASVGQAITFDASQSSDPDGQIVSYLWTFGDGTASSQAVATHAYAQGGAYTVTLVVTDNEGATGTASGEVFVATSSNTPPNAVVAVSTSQPLVGETVTFDASQSSDADGQIVSYLWTFGDGATSTQPVATHAYATAGSYTATLAVTDNGGATSQASTQLNVSTTAVRLTVTPGGGSLAPGASQTITVRYNASGVTAGNYQGRLSIASAGGALVVPVRVEVQTSVAAEDAPELPRQVRLAEAYPNPFNPSTMLRVELPAPAEVELTVYDALGRQVAVLLRERLPAGGRDVRFEAAGLPSGVYFARLQAGQEVQTRKLVLLR